MTRAVFRKLILVSLTLLGAPTLEAAGRGGWREGDTITLHTNPLYDPHAHNGFHDDQRLRLEELEEFGRSPVAQPVTEGFSGRQSITPPLEAPVVIAQPEVSAVLQDDENENFAEILAQGEAAREAARLKMEEERQARDAQPSATTPPPPLSEDIDQEHTLRSYPETWKDKVRNFKRKWLTRKTKAPSTPAAPTTKTSWTVRDLFSKKFNSYVDREHRQVGITVNDGVIARYKKLTTPTDTSLQQPRMGKVKGALMALLPARAPKSSAQEDWTEAGRRHQQQQNDMEVPQNLGKS